MWFHILVCGCVHMLYSVIALVNNLLLYTISRVERETRLKIYGSSPMFSPSHYKFMVNTGPLHSVRGCVAQPSLAQPNS